MGIPDIKKGDYIAFKRPDTVKNAITADKGYEVKEVLPEGFSIINDDGERLACGSEDVAPFGLSRKTWSEWGGYIIYGAAYKSSRVCLPMFPNRSGWHVFEGFLCGTNISIGRFERFWNHSLKLWLRTENCAQGHTPAEIPREWHYMGACLSQKEFDILARSVNSDKRPAESG